VRSESDVSVRIGEVMNTILKTMKYHPLAMTLLLSAFLAFSACGKYGMAAGTLDFLKFESFNCDVVMVENGRNFYCRPPDMDIESIRLIGVSIHEDSENDAKKYCESILRRGTLVKIEPDKELMKKEKDVSAYVFVPGGKMLNVLLIEKGYAEPAQNELNNKYKSYFIGAKNEEKPEECDTIDQGEKPPWLR
jgi:endonuclease YncB( thermonuclease family)